MRNQSATFRSKAVLQLAKAILLAFSAGYAAGTAQTLATAPSDERFVAGEALAIDIPMDTSAFLIGGYPIDSAGYAELPILGRIEVGGKQRGMVEEFVGQKLSNYLKDTHIQITPAIRLTLLGHWGRQGQYYVSSRTTVWEAVYRAGGIGGERNLDKIKVMRGEGELPISLLSEYSKGTTLAAAGIRSGDIFVMPVPRDNTGAWYWFRETLGATAEIATVASTLLTAYITYLLIEDRN